MIRDPQFGPIVIVGAGGVLVELLDDRRAALAPFGRATARRLLDGLKLRRLLDGYRGGDAGRCRTVSPRSIALFSVLAADLADLDRGDRRQSACRGPRHCRARRPRRRQTGDSVMDLSLPVRSAELAAPRQSLRRGAPLSARDRARNERARCPPRRSTACAAPCGSMASTASTTPRTSAARAARSSN